MKKNSLRNRHGGLLAEGTQYSQKVCCGLFHCRSASIYYGESVAGLDSVDIIPQRTIVCQKQRTKIYFSKDKSTAPPRTCGKSAAFWVRGGLWWSLQQVGLSPREKYTRQIRQRSAGSPRGYKQIRHLIAAFRIFLMRYKAFGRYYSPLSENTLKAVSMICLIKIRPPPPINEGDLNFELSFLTSMSLYSHQGLCHCKQLKFTLI